MRPYVYNILVACVKNGVFKCGLSISPRDKALGSICFELHKKSILSPSQTT